MNYLNPISWLLSSIVILWFLNITPVQALTTTQEKATAQDFLQLGIEQIQSKHYSEALEEFSHALQLNPDFAQAYHNRCWVAIKLDNYQLAARDCLQAVELDPSDIESDLNLGIAYHRSGDFSQAMLAYNQLLQQHPQEGRAYYNRALVEMELKDYETAITDYNQALIFSQALDPSKLAEIYIDRGIAYLLTQEMPKAMTDLNQAITLNLINPRGYYNRGCVYFFQGKIENAIQDFDTVLTLDPFDAQAYLSRGQLYQKQGLYAKALTDLNQASQQFIQQENREAYLQTVVWIKALQQWLASVNLKVFT